MPPHYSHLNDLFVFDSSGPGGLDISTEELRDILFMN